jgi:hypothetical protein
MIYSIIVLLSALLLFSACTGKKEYDQNVPDAFQKNSNISELSSFKRWNSSIVEELYQDLTKKNEELKQLEQSINDLKADEKSKTEEIVKFFDDNTNYYDNAISMTANITDSILRTEIINTLNADKQEYLSNINEIQGVMDEIRKKSEELNNYHIALKIALTMDVIHNYQTSLKTDTTALRNIVKNYDGTINLVKEELKK